MSSLKNRLSLGLALSLVALLGIQWAIVSYTIAHLTTEQVAERLRSEGETLLAGISFDAQGEMLLDARWLSPIYQRPFSGRYFFIDGNGVQRLSRSLWDETLQLPRVGPGEEAVVNLPGPQRQTLLVVVQGFRKQGHEVRLAIAEDLSHLNADLRYFQIVYGIVSITILILLLLVQRTIVENSLSMLLKVRADMARLGRGEISQVEAPGPDEIAPLIAELNRLLAGMERRTRRSREALGNLAHGLKTRLTLLNQLAEQPALVQSPEMRSAIYDATAGIGDVVERELKRARLMGDSMPGRRVALHDEVMKLLHTLRSMYPEKLPEITAEVAPDATFFGDQEDLLEMLGNLLDNACKWCRRQVSLTVTDHGGTAFIIEDDGPGCLIDDLTALTGRGFRLDESRPGSGLGLAIVKDIVDSYGGSLTFGRSASLGGLRVEVRLPGTACPDDRSQGTSPGSH